MITKWRINEENRKRTNKPRIVVRSINLHSMFAILCIWVQSYVNKKFHKKIDSPIVFWRNFYIFTTVNEKTMFHNHKTKQRGN